MIVVLKHGVTDDKRDQLISWLKNLGLQIHISVGAYQTVLGLIGDTSRVDMDLVGSLEIVDAVKRVTEPFKCCNRKFHPEDMVVDCQGVKIGGGNFVMIAGPCSVESEEQIVTVAKAVKAAGAQILRGGAFKPRTSPYDFPGLKATGLELLKIARQETGLPFVTEIMSVADLPLFEDVDMLQVGARNMQNFDLLRELGKMDKPVLLKRGPGQYPQGTAHERRIHHGQRQRAGHPLRAGHTHLQRLHPQHPGHLRRAHAPRAVPPARHRGPQPRHRHRQAGAPCALAGAAAGADGLIIEVHNDPIHALCDGAQSLRPEEYAALAEKVAKVREAIV